MTLFFAAETAPPATDTATLDTLQKRLQEMEEHARLAAKYGNNLNPAQIQFYREQEAQEKLIEEKRRVHAEQAAVSKQARLERITKAARDRAENGTLIAYLGDDRVKINPDDLTVPCQDCDGNIALSSVLLPYAEVLLERRLDAIKPWGGATMWRTFQGLPCIHESLKCPNCGKMHQTLIFYTGW